MFKKGDRVMSNVTERSSYSGRTYFAKGDIGTVIGVQSCSLLVDWDKSDTVLELDGTDWAVSPKDVELISEYHVIFILAEVSRADDELRVGDRVVTTDYTRDAVAGCTGKIVSIYDKSSVLVQFDWSRHIDFSNGIGGIDGRWYVPLWALKRI